MLKFRVSNIEDVAEDYRGLYEKKTVDGKEVHVLQVEGVVDKARIDEFRNSNVKERERREKAEAGLKEFQDAGLTPEKARELADKQNEIEAGKLIKSDTLDAAVEKRTQQLIKEHKTAVETLTADLGATKGMLSKKVIEGTLLVVGRRFGLRKGADADIVARGKGVWVMIDGGMVAVESDGKTKIYGKDGVTPLSPEEWMKTQAENGAKHLFEENSGGGASGGASGAGANGTIHNNPFKKGDHWNLTEQMKVIRANPKLAERFKSEAGVK